ncbi:MAG: C40 family peptidase [Bacteroidia bacterium]|nr:C40 family peptidase [Bacteroidia bacterium]
MVFFSKSQEQNARVVHVGIYLGKGQVIHAFDRVQIDPLDAQGNLSHLKRYLKGIRRPE